VPMVFLRTLANMACSRGRGPANRLAGMIVLPDSAVSRKRKGKGRGRKGYQTVGLQKYVPIRRRRLEATEDQVRRANQALPHCECQM